MATIHSRGRAVCHDPVKAYTYARIALDLGESRARGNNPGSQSGAVAMSCSRTAARSKRTGGCQTSLRSIMARGPQARSTSPLSARVITV